jgi:hypothetical protein
LKNRRGIDAVIDFPQQRVLGPPEVNAASKREMSRPSAA